MIKSMQFFNESKPIQSVMVEIDNINRGGIDLRPTYQRGYIWSDDFKNKLIYSIINHYPIGNISIRQLNVKNEKGATKEVVDGQQRLNTIFDFYNGKYSVYGEMAKMICRDIVDYLGDTADKKDKKLSKIYRYSKLKGTVVLSFDDLPDDIQREFQGFNLAITNITNASDVTVREYFNYVQNQERLRAGEIINSLPDTVLSKYLEQIVNVDGLLSNLGFKDARKEFDKIFYSMIGIIEKKISFGTTDKKIEEFVKEHKEVSSESKIAVKGLIEQLNYLSQYDEDQVIEENEKNMNLIEKANKRLIKYMMLLMIFKLVDFKFNTQEKFKELEKLNTKMSAFASAKAYSESAKFSEYSNECIDELRYIMLISKGAHSYERAKNRMEMLAYYLNNPNNTQQSSGVLPIELIKNI